MRGGASRGGQGKVKKREGKVSMASREKGKEGMVERGGESRVG
jgi:hypothetical protein